MSTPRAAPPTSDVKQIMLEEQLQRLNVSQLRNLKDGARTASQEAASRERRRNATDPWPVPARGVRKCRANAGTASMAQVERVSGSDPGAPHNVTLVGSKTKPDSEKKDTAAPSTATMKEGLPLKDVDTHEESMSLTLEEAYLQAISEKT